jgi:streptogramin lyase
MVIEFTPTLPLSMLSAWANAPYLGPFTAPGGLAVGDPGGAPFPVVADTGGNTVSTFPLAGGPGAHLAGNGAAGHVDGQGAVAEFDAPSEVAVAADGSIYVVDQDSSALRRILPAGPTVSTLGGGNNGLPSYGAVDGLGPAARFGLLGPQGLAADAAGNTFVADPGNSTIRRITPQGQVSTFAGIPGQAGYRDGPGALFTRPYQLAIDAKGNLYVTERAANRIRRITPLGVVSTFMNAGLDNPAGLAVDTAGNVYEADFGTQAILAFAPDGTPLPTPGLVGAALNVTALAAGPNGSLYGLDATARAVFQFTPPAAPGAAWLVGYLVQDSDLGALDQDAAGNPQFNGPAALTVDSTGNVFVADSGNGLIRKIAPDGVVTTLAGSYPLLGTGSGLGPEVPLARLPGLLRNLTGIAVTPAGDLVVSTGSAVFTITAP